MTNSSIKLDIIDRDRAEADAKRLGLELTIDESGPGEWPEAKFEGSYDAVHAIAVEYGTETNDVDFIVSLIK